MRTSRPELGFELLKGSESMVLQTAAAIAISHHERYDGGGYPFGLSGDVIPLFGRIVAIADVFDALTSARPYKKAWPIEQALSHVRAGSGRHFDPDGVEALLSCQDDVLNIHAQYRDCDLPHIACVSARAA